MPSLQKCSLADTKVIVLLDLSIDVWSNTSRAKDPQLPLMLLCSNFVLHLIHFHKKATEGAT